MLNRQRAPLCNVTFPTSRLHMRGLCDVAVRFLGLGSGAAAMALVPALRIPVGLLLVAWVAYANGSNDVSKAIAALVGSGVSNYRRVIVWGTATTFLGAALSALTGTALVATFANGLVAHQPTLAFARVRRLSGLVEPVSAVLLLVTGAYVVFYWLSPGGVLASIEALGGNG